MEIREREKKKFVERANVEIGREKKNSSERKCGKKERKKK